MKNILLLGDSIRIGYDKATKLSLEGRAEVYFPEENCRFASYLLRYFHEYLPLVPDKRVDILHWNAGLWDCLHLFGEEAHTPIEVYAYYIDRLCLRIRKLLPKAEVVFATSTAVQEEKMGESFFRHNSEIAAYNDAAVEVVRKHGFAVNDLYPTSLALPEEAHSDAVHYYTALGTEVFTKQVLSFLDPLIGDGESATYREFIHGKTPIGF